MFRASFQRWCEPYQRLKHHHRTVYRSSRERDESSRSSASPGKKVKPGQERAVELPSACAEVDAASISRRRMHGTEKRIEVMVSCSEISITSEQHSAIGRQSKRTMADHIVCFGVREDQGTDLRW